MVGKENQINDNTKSSENPKLSYFHSIGNNPLVYTTIGQQLSVAAREYGEHEAFVFPEENKRYTYTELLKEVDELAAGFQCLGLNKGDRVAILTPNVSTWPIVMYACARAGLIFVTLNPTYEPVDIESCLKKLSAKVLVASENFGPFPYYDKILEVIPELGTNQSGNIQCKKLPFLSAVIIDSAKHFPGTLRLKDIQSLPTVTQVKNIEKQQCDICPESGCNIQFTSGFTGEPKAVLLSHFSIINITYNTERIYLFKCRFCMSLPFCHIGALSAVTIGSLCNQGTVVVPSFMLNAEKTLRTISDEKCTLILTMPKLYMDLVMHQKQLKLNIENLSGIMGGTKCSGEQYLKIKKELRMKELKVGFGMTEYCGIAFLSFPEDSEEQILGTVGSVMNNIEVKVIDKYGKLVPFGMPGELCIRGYPTMIGYWGDEEKTDEVLGRNGWLRTGDYFILNENGYGRSLGRISDMIIKGKEYILPDKIEKLLETCPKIAEAYVIGVPDAILGEELCAFIRPHDELNSISPKDIFDFCEGKISAFYIPKYVQLVNEFTKTISGKVRKLELKKQFLNTHNN